jgi:aspartate racemase
MKLIGMLGGLGWEATSRYYRMINEYTQKQLGEQHTARILLQWRRTPKSAPKSTES